ncbi:MAG: hypothetical protein JSW47_16045 [Phycisphaerales bacterium]|nr:MAG: hypothetical protein JSW47_16045 [Phycisphaerales bacterium]
MSSIRVDGSTFNPIDIAIAGMRGQGKRLEDISSGIAGIGKTAGSTGSGGSGASSGLETGGGARAVTMDDLPMQMININKATRAYQANVAVLKRYERMIDTTLELLR